MYDILKEGNVHALVILLGTTMGVDQFSINDNILIELLNQHDNLSLVTDMCVKVDTTVRLYKIQGISYVLLLKIDKVICELDYFVMVQ